MKDEAIFSSKLKIIYKSLSIFVGKIADKKFCKNIIEN